jgi:pimeloyl-ACP methyl ester carboxylesterase
MFTYFQRDFTVCAMDRRAHGQSGDGPSYSLKREAEDVAAVVASRPGPVAVLGHSFGGVAAYEAAFLTPQITKLMLYEPPFRVPAHSAVLARMDRLIKAGDREAATTTFMREVVRVSPEELTAMQRRPSWKALVSSIGSSIRQHRALGAYKWAPARARKLRTPTLLLIGSRTASPHLRLSARSAADALPNRKIVVLEGQEHNAMDTAREQLAGVIKEFMLARYVR